MSATLQTSTLEYLLRLGDNALVLSHRLSEWCGKGPALEEDMALTNVALDLLGQARLWLSYAAELKGQGADEDRLAYLRDAPEFRNVLLVEQPNREYSDTLIRQFFFDAWHALALRELAQSSDPRISEIAVKARKEVTYHLRRSSDLVIRLGDGTSTSNRMMQSAVDQLWPFTGELFETDEIDATVASEAVGFEAKKLKSEWQSYVADVLATGQLQLPPNDIWMQKGGKRGVHSEHLSHMLSQMQVLQRSHPGANW